MYISKFNGQVVEFKFLVKEDLMDTSYMAGACTFNVRNCGQTVPPVSGRVYNVNTCTFNVNLQLSVVVPVKFVFFKVNYTPL